MISRNSFLDVMPGLDPGIQIAADAMALDSQVKPANDKPRDAAGGAP